MTWDKLFGQTRRTFLKAAIAVGVLSSTRRTTAQAQINAEIADVEVYADRVTYNDTVPADVTIRNTGATEADFYVDYNVVAPGEDDPFPRRVDGEDGAEATLAPGDEATVAVEWDVDDDASTGGYDIYVAVYDQSPEADITVPHDEVTLRNAFELRGSGTSDQNGTDITGYVIHPDGKKVPDAKVLVVNGDYDDEPTRELTTLDIYDSDEDQPNLSATTARTDSNGQFSLTLSDTYEEPRFIAQWNDSKNDTVWFSTVKTDSSELKLSNELLYGPQKVHYQDLSNTPIFSGTIIVWRSIDENNPQKQRIYLELTETASGTIDEARLSGETLREISPWEISLDVKEISPSNYRLAYYRPSIQEILASIIFPEDIDIDTKSIQLYEAFDDELNTSGGSTREALTHWHPLRRPTVPAFICTPDSYSPIERDTIQKRIEQENLQNFIGMKFAELITKITPFKSDDAILSLYEGLVELTPDDWLGEKVGEEIAQDARPSENTHNRLDLIWFKGQRFVTGASSIVFEIPMTVPDENADNIAIIETVWESNGPAHEIFRTGFEKRLLFAGI